MEALDEGRHPGCAECRVEGKIRCLVTRVSDWSWKASVHSQADDGEPSSGCRYYPDFLVPLFPTTPSQSMKDAGNFGVAFSFRTSLG